MREELKSSEAAKLVLASESRYRRELMDRLQLPYLAVPHRFDEASQKELISDPWELAVSLARKKAESLKESYPAAVIIGSDQVLEVGGEILGKPGDEETALRQLTRLSGTTHRLITAIAVLAPERNEVLCEVDTHQLKMRSLTRSELLYYIRRDHPLDCAGSYRIESLGIALFESIEGADHTAIIGLPMLILVELLNKVGVSVFER